MDDAAKTYNMDELRKKLDGFIDDLTEDKIDARKAEALGNMAGKIIGTARAQMEYEVLKKDLPGLSIPYLENREALKS